LASLNCEIKAIPFLVFQVLEVINESLILIFIDVKDCPLTISHASHGTNVVSKSRRPVAFDN
jgi:hypothetical protein